MGQRAQVTVGRSHVVKEHVTAAAAQAEAAWYERAPWAAPRLLDVVGARLVIEKLPVSTAVPGWRPATALWELLERLHAESIHHRDVHVKNVVRGTGGPLLIDWETAIWQPSELSYDLHGPEASGVPVPDIHAGLTPQWWGSAQPASISKRWRAPCIRSISPAG